MGRRRREPPQRHVLQGRLPPGQQPGRHVAGGGGAVQLGQAAGAVGVRVVRRQPGLVEQLPVDVVQGRDGPADLGGQPGPRRQVGQLQGAPGQVGVDRGPAALLERDEPLRRRHRERQPPGEHPRDRPVHRGTAQRRPAAVRRGRTAVVRRGHLPHPSPVRAGPCRRHGPRTDRPAGPVGGGPGGRVAVAVRADADPRRPRRRGDPRGVRGRARTHRADGSAPSPAGRTRRWPTRPTTSPRWSARRPRGRRLGDGGLRPRPGGPAGPPPREPGPPGRRAAPGHARSWPPPPRHQAAVDSCAHGCAGSTTTPPPTR